MRLTQNDKIQNHICLFRLVSCVENLFDSIFIPKENGIIQAPGEFWDSTKKPQSIQQKNQKMKSFEIVYVVHMELNILNISVYKTCH